ncbi:MAG: extracellular solute-binding protein, partial [Chloroflexi bacterium]|nr:extracellular solute-binding protein [Chloroflexota bacterium]
MGGSMTTTRAVRALAVTALATSCLAGLLAPAHAAPARRAAADSSSLVLYSSQGYDSAMAKAFAKVSGTQVKLTDDSTGILLAKITAERNNPHWDVVWFDGDATMQSLNNQGMLLKWTPANLKNYTALGRSLVPADHAFYPTGVTAAGVIIYNTKHMTAAQAPKDWTDLLTSRFKNGVAENDPAYSGPAFPYISGQMLRQGGTNLAKGEAFFTKLKANGLKIFQTNDPTLNSVQTGARQIGIVQDSAYYAAAATGAPLGVVYPASGVTTLPGVVGINMHSKHLKQAEAFVNYILSQTGQNVMIHDPNDSDAF